MIHRDSMYLVAKELLFEAESGKPRCFQGRHHHQIPILGLAPSIYVHVWDRWSWRIVVTHATEIYTWHSFMIQHANMLEDVSQRQTYKHAGS